jgi:predicted membrane channel-forming protein YqfA (hemolysin III family)
LILDWGYSGLYLSLALLGLLAQTSWLVVRRDAPFPVVMFCALVLLNIVYLPTAIGISDTNILFATLASLAAIAFRIGFPRRVASAKPFAPVPEAAA